MATMSTVLTSTAVTRRLCPYFSLLYSTIATAQRPTKIRQASKTIAGITKNRYVEELVVVSREAVAAESVNK